jgi:hypothetical protein
MWCQSQPVNISIWDGGAGQLIFVPSYFDYVRLRNFLKGEEAAFAGLSEYAAPRKAARGRSLFADGRLRLALLTERSHFYHRVRVRGVRVRVPPPCLLRCMAACRVVCGASYWH